MSAIKVISVVLLSFLLSLSLIAFGLVFTVKMTALNPDFVASRVDALDVSDIVEEAIEQQAADEGISEEFTGELQVALVDTIDRLEPVVKERIDDSVHSVFDYLTAKKDSPELALTLRETFLDAEYIAAFLDEIDMSSLADTYFNSEDVQQDLPEQFSQEIQDALVDTVDRLEPLLKERAGVIAEHVFDYILGMTQELDLASVLRSDLLDAEFVDALLDGIDIPSLVADVDLSSLVLDFLEEEASEDLPEDVEYLAGYVDEIILELEPWIRDQVDIVADPVFDYILGISQSIDVSLSLEPVKDALGDTLRQEFLASPPAELSGLSQTELEQYFDEHFGELADELPATFELDEEALGGLRADLTDGLADVEESLGQARQDIADGLADAEEAFGESREYVGHFMLGYNLLFVFILLLIAGIALIYREVKGTCRTLAGIFISFGVLNIVAVLVARAVLRTPIEQIEDVPPSLLEWLMQTTGSALMPLLILAIVLLVVGIALLVFAIIYGRRHSGMAAEYQYISSGEDEPRP